MTIAPGERIEPSGYRYVVSCSCTPEEIVYVWGLGPPEGVDAGAYTASHVLEIEHLHKEHPL